MKSSRIIFVVRPDEREEFESQAKIKGLTLNNYVRQRLGLVTLSHGGKREKAGRRKDSNKNDELWRKSRERWLPGSTEKGD